MSPQPPETRASRPRGTPCPPGTLSAQGLIRDRLNPHTRRAYRGALARLSAWLAGHSPTDDAFAAYLGHLDAQGKSPATCTDTEARAPPPPEGLGIRAWPPGSGAKQGRHPQGAKQHIVRARARHIASCTSSQTRALPGPARWAFVPSRACAGNPAAAHPGPAAARYLPRRTQGQPADARAEPSTGTPTDRHSSYGEGTLFIASGQQERALPRYRFYVGPRRAEHPVDIERLQRTLETTKRSLAMTGLTMDINNKAQRCPQCTMSSGKAVAKPT